MGSVYARSGHHSILLSILLETRSLTLTLRTPQPPAPVPVYLSSHFHDYMGTPLDNPHPFPDALVPLISLANGEQMAAWQPLLWSSPAWLTAHHAHIDGSYMVPTASQ